jgi:hypothetical protein
VSRLRLLSFETKSYTGTVAIRNGAQNTRGIQFVTAGKGRTVAVFIDLKRHGAIWEDFRDGLVSESRRADDAVPYEQCRAKRLKRIPPRG